MLVSGHFSHYAYVRHFGVVSEGSFNIILVYDIVRVETCFTLSVVIILGV